MNEKIHSSNVRAVVIGFALATFLVGISIIAVDGWGQYRCASYAKESETATHYVRFDDCYVTDPATNDDFALGTYKNLRARRAALIEDRKLTDGK